MPKASKASFNLIEVGLVKTIGGRHLRGRGRRPGQRTGSPPPRGRYYGLGESMGDTPLQWASPRRIWRVPVARRWLAHERTAFVNTVRGSASAKAKIRPRTEEARLRTRPRANANRAASSPRWYYFVTWRSSGSALPSAKVVLRRSTDFASAQSFRDLWNL